MKRYIARDISWLSFNARVLQEANDKTVPLKQRIRFLGIFSNNLDEFFRVRVATLRRMSEIINKKKIPEKQLIESPSNIIDQIQKIVLKQQNEFNRIWDGIKRELTKNNVQLLSDYQLDREQKQYIRYFFDEYVRHDIIPLMIDKLPELPYLRDKSLYLAIVLKDTQNSYKDKFSLIEVPTKTLDRFIKIPDFKNSGKQAIILLEDVIKLNLPTIFSHFHFNKFDAHIFKITKDAEIDMDQEIGINLVEKLSKGIKNRRKGKPVRLVYDKEMNPELLDYLIKKLNLSRKSNIIPGSKIHNFRDFMNFPVYLPEIDKRPKPIKHPLLVNSKQIIDVVSHRDILLNFPYHSFESLIDMLREAAMDDDVISIKVTAYRLAKLSKVINALINASRNGKQVTVVLELKARFDEEANLAWKTIMEEEGIKVIVDIPNMKVHAKIGQIRKKVNGRIIQYGFVSTGNLNGKTAAIYADHCLLTSNKTIMADIARVFQYLENWQDGYKPLEQCKKLLICPVNMRTKLIELINKEIAFSKKGIKSSIIVKLNSLSDLIIIDELYKAAKAGVTIHLIIRGIFTMKREVDRKNLPIHAISIVDEYLEHSRVIVFRNNGNPKVYISSADWMVRNFDHRVEVAAPIFDEQIKKELVHILQIQLNDNTKARLLNPDLENIYVHSPTDNNRYRSQEMIHQYLSEKDYSIDSSSH